MSNRLEDAVRIIARHADFAGKPRLMGCCVNEIDERFRVGQVTHDEKERLIGILRSEVADAAN